MKTYRIIARTNNWIAQRDMMFQGKSSIVLAENLSLLQAQRWLLNKFNEMFEDELPYASNWGMAVICSGRKSDGASATRSDGTRSFEYDGRTFEIEEETKE